jgi:hypothetical protein
MASEESKLNDAAFRRMEDSLAKTYPRGQFVAFMSGEIVADAADFDELQAKLKAAGKDPYQAFIVQAGHSYPKKAVILSL